MQKDNTFLFLIVGVAVMLILAYFSLLTHFNPLMPSVSTAEITSQDGQCQLGGLFYITGDIVNHSDRSLNVILEAASYNSDKVKLGSGGTFVSIDPKGISKYQIIIPNGCPSGSSASSYRVWVNNINYS